MCEENMFKLYFTMIEKIIIKTLPYWHRQGVSVVLLSLKKITLLTW